MDLLTDFEGRSIRLSDERWQHICQHPEMAGMRQPIEETLKWPEAVVQSAADPGARLYYRFYHRTVVGGKHLCVVVKLLEADAFVVTAYLTDRVKKGEMIWPREW
jgi:hypothetical protein